MSLVETHIVAQQRIELEFQDRRDTNVSCERILAACNAKAAEIIEECCKDLVAPNEFITIPYLELELGVLDEVDLSSNFLEKFRESLREALELHLETANPFRKELRALDLIRNYGITGNYPWWAGSTNAQLLFSAVDLVIASPEVEIIEKYKEVLLHGICLERLLNALSDRQIAETWARMRSIQGPRSAEGILGDLRLRLMFEGQRMNQNRWRKLAHALILETIQKANYSFDSKAFVQWLQLNGPEDLPKGLNERIEAGGAYVFALSWLQKYLEMPANLIVNLFLNTAKWAQKLNFDVTKIEIGKAELRAWLSGQFGLRANAIDHFLQAMSRAQEIEMPKDDLIQELAKEKVNFQQILAKMGLENASLALVLEQLLEDFANQYSSEKALQIQDLSIWLKLHYSISENEFQYIQENYSSIILNRLQRINSEIEERIISNISTRTRKSLILSQTANDVDIVNALWLRFGGKKLKDTKLIFKWLKHDLGLANISFEMLENVLQKLARQFDAQSFENTEWHNTNDFKDSPIKKGFDNAQSLFKWLQDQFGFSDKQGQQLKAWVEILWTKLFPDSVSATSSDDKDRHLWNTLQVQLGLEYSKPQDILASFWKLYRSENPNLQVSDETLQSWLNWVINHFQLPQIFSAKLVPHFEKFLNEIQLQSADIAEPEKDSFEKQEFAQESTSNSIQLTQLLKQLKAAFGTPKVSDSEFIERIWNRFIDAEGPYHGNGLKLRRWLMRQFLWKADVVNAFARKILDDRKLPDENPEALFSDLANSQRQNSDLEQSIWIENAGLVILWPMLERMLGYQGLVENKAFLDSKALQSAVCLLQGLVACQDEWNEAALVLPKILCGLMPDALVDIGMAPDAEKVEEAQLVLQAVLAHWPLAGKMSNEGFQHAWLQRRGSLRLHDDHWLLRVETMAQDILLEGLPWDIAYIQLPWMPYALYVDWGEKAKFNG